MYVVLIARDKPGHLQTRLDNREAHLAYARASGILERGGPLLDDNGEMAGSMAVLNVPDMKTAEDFAANDPYNKAGLFAEVTLQEWKQVIAP
ncbi:YciI family protein [Tranquillimonas alkanivorans]|uniref:YCII-related domain-containing protein n=1 Tax=Tranquillimonas alkanivorans TaxID=441119 RepID=A0A1I5W8E4_9RHOB|nr:YciI family protein [Tranquillimonas alkanivorans]SFQ15877.1 hypothetical protein SAMN04488047_14127 [Tranquillimonas alkanivorans]